MPLTERQQRFVEEYLVDGNATRAAVRAGYSERTAQEQGSRLLSNVMVADAVNAARAARSERVRLSADDVLEELAVLGRSNVWDYQVDDRGRVTLAAGARPGAIRAVSAVKYKVRHLGNGRVEYETELKLWDKNSALEKAARHLGLLKDQLGLTINGLEDVLNSLPADVARELRRLFAGEVPAGGGPLPPGEPPALR